MPRYVVVPKARYHFQLRCLVNSRHRQVKAEKELAERESELEKVKPLLEKQQRLEKRLAETVGELSRARQLLDHRKKPCETCESPSHVILINCGHGFCPSCASYLFLNLESNEMTDQLRCPCHDNGPVPSELSQDQQPTRQKRAEYGTRSTAVIVTEDSGRREEPPGTEIDDAYERDTDIIDDSEVEDETNVLHGIDETNPVRKLLSNDSIPTREAATGIDTINTTVSPAQVGEQVGGH